MTGLPIVDVAIGLVIIYALLSLLCTFVSEFVLRVTSARAKTLRVGIQELLCDPKMMGLAREVYAHPLIKNLGSMGSKPPSYITSTTFAKALIDVVDPKAKTRNNAKEAIDSFRFAVHKMHYNEAAREALQALIGQADVSLKTATKNIEQWFNDGMDQMSGRYKRKKQIVSLVVAIVIAVGFNANTIVMTKAFWIQPQLQKTMNITDSKLLNRCKEGVEYACRKYVMIKTVPLPIGWREPDGRSWRTAEWQLSMLGWLITALAISLGVQYWLDLLKMLLPGIKPKMAA